MKWLVLTRLVFRGKTSIRAKLLFLSKMQARYDTYYSDADTWPTLTHMRSAGADRGLIITNTGPASAELASGSQRLLLRQSPSALRKKDLMPLCRPDQL